MEIADMISQGGEEAEIAYLVSLWSDQMTSDTVDNTPGHEEVMGRLVMESQHQEFWEQSCGLVMCMFLSQICCVIVSRHVTTYDFSFTFLFITYTFTVSHMTDNLYFLT